MSGVISTSELVVLPGATPVVNDVEARRQRRRERQRMRMRKTRQLQTPEQLERERQRKQEARKRQTPEQRRQETHRRQTPEQRQRENERKRGARRRQTPEQRERERQRQNERPKMLRPFMAVDGEGAGTDRLGRQPYVLMVAARPGGEEYIKHCDGRALSVRDCLEFLLSLPPSSKVILVGFFLNYDATQIIRGIGKTETLQRILEPPLGRNGPCYTYWGDYAILYEPQQYFRVARLDRTPICSRCGTVNKAAPDHPAAGLIDCLACGNRFRPKARIVKGSVRTVYDVFGFFGCSFVKAIKDWEIGSEQERAFIARNKNRRDEFSELTGEMVEYCKLECRYLALLMENFREVCAARGIKPERWTGAGQLAANLLKQEGVPKRPLTAREIVRNLKKPDRRRPERDPQFEIAANLGFYGGRFETSRIGPIGDAVEHDIHSAYPAGMPALPCPLHTRWLHYPRAKRLPDGGLYLAKITFIHPPDNLWCGLPFRRNWRVFWPAQGTGWYWSPEIEAARRCLGAEVIRVHDLWVARRECECHPFDWVPRRYQERWELGNDTRGHPLKLGLNSLYGKLAQRSGSGPYHDAAAAGLITAMTRARLVEAVAHDPEAVVMLATDAVFSTRPLPLDIGPGLGQWKPEPRPDLFIVKPGVYWSSSEHKKSLKSRGAPRSVIEEAVPEFERAFAEWAVKLHEPGGLERVLQDRALIPAVSVKIRTFIGCRRALARDPKHTGKWQGLAGKWVDVPQRETFEWNTKRDAMHVRLDDRGCLVTRPIQLSPFAESEGYEPEDFDRRIEIVGDAGKLETVADDMLVEGARDFLDWLPRE